MRLLGALLVMVVLSGCGCGAWRAGTKERRGAAYDPSLEPWFGHELRAHRETRYCHYWLSSAAFRWQTEWAPRGEFVNRTFLGSTGRIWKAIHLEYGDETTWQVTEREKAFRDEHAAQVVAVRPFVFVTHKRGYRQELVTDLRVNELRASTVFTTTDVPVVWVSTTWEAREWLEPQPLALADGESQRFPVEWGALVFTRTADTYNVTTEGDGG